MSRARKSNLPKLRELPTTHAIVREPALARASIGVVLGVAGVESSDLHASVLEGFAFSAFQHLQERVQLSADEMGAWLLIAPRTLARRKKEGRLHPEESDRLLRAARVFAATVELFDGDEAAARRWLSSSCTGLGGARPIDVARTDVGTREVEALIGRLEHGVVV